MHTAFSTILGCENTVNVIIFARVDAVHCESRAVMFRNSAIRKNPELQDHDRPTGLFFRLIFAFVIIGQVMTRQRRSSTQLVVRNLEIKHVTDSKKCLCDTCLYYVGE